VIQQNDTTTVLNKADSPILLAQGSAGGGSWQLMSYTCPVNPIHAALLRTGRILFVSGSGNDPANVDNPPGTAVWNVSNGTFSTPVNPVDDDRGNIPIDLFCGGHSFLPDGRLMFASGTLQYDPFYGLPAYFIFDPITEQWAFQDVMAAGRWYPTLVTLGDGRILAVSGLEETGLLETYPSIYSAGTGFSYFSNPTSELPMYAHLFLLSSGKIFFSGACFARTGVSPRILTLPGNLTQSITETPAVSGLQNADYVEQAASVLLPPAQDQKVMIIGGGNGFSGQATNRVNIVDLTASNPTYTAAASLNYARMHHNAVLLPDRTVFVCNGSAMGEDGSKATRTPEIYNPATNTWTTGATANVNNRLYHSLALLLPDGRVATAGGNPDRGDEELRLEIYSPWYMSQSRPVINSAPQQVNYNVQFQIQTPQAANIKWVSLIRPMATTHGLDTEQRLVNVTINSVSGTTLNVTLTNNKNLTPPGYYMLFITNQNNVPSVANWVKVS